MLMNIIALGPLYHVAIPTDVSLLSLSGRRQSRAAGLQRMTRGPQVNMLLKKITFSETASR